MSRCGYRPGPRSSRRASPTLATDKARFVGEPVAMVVAETHDAAKDAAELVEVEYEPCRPWCARADAVQAGAPLVWDDVRRQYERRRRGRRQGGDRRGLRARRARRAVSTPGFSASPACRWSRAPRSATTTPRAGATRSMPEPAAAWCASGRPGAACWTCRRERAARCAATWAAISARATPSFPNTGCCRGRRAASAGR